MNLPGAFIKFNNKHLLLEEGDKIIVGASGGPDSMTLLHLLRRSGFQIAAAHCNYQLRGEDSELDEQLVRSYCDELQIPFFTKKVNLKQQLNENASALQETARTIRYDFFRELLQQGYNKIATAHHANDNAETILLNMTRGTGVKGLSGIPVKNKEVVRPLLFAAKEDILEYTHIFDIPFREDISNKKNNYSRNKIRNEVIPILEEINPAVIENLHKQSDILREAQLLIEEEVEGIKALMEHEQNEVRIPMDIILNHLTPVTILFELLEPYGFNSSQVEQMLDHAAKQSGRYFYSDKFKLAEDRNYWIITSKSSTEPKDTLFENEAALLQSHKLQSKLVEMNNFKLSKDSTIAQLDAEKIQYPLLLRTWNEGDKFTPLGMQKSKKLSDFFIDEKIPVHKKPQIKILESAGEIVWIEGYRISDLFKVDEQTKKVLVLQQAN